MDLYSGSPERLGEELRTTKTAWIVLGLVELLAGFVALSMPGVAALATTMVMGLVVGVAGLVRLVHAFQVRRWSGMLGQLLLAVLYLATAGLIIARPVMGAISLALVVGVWCIATGVVQMIMAVRQPRLPAWGWMLATGVAGIVLGALILTGWPAAAVWAVGLLVGINLVFTGIGALMVGASIPQVGLHEPPTAPA